jgi:hypothetical protein
VRGGAVALCGSLVERGLADECGACVCVCAHACRLQARLQQNLMYLAAVADAQPGAAASGAAAAGAAAPR